MTNDSYQYSKDHSIHLQLQFRFNKRTTKFNIISSLSYICNNQVQTNTLQSTQNLSRRARGGAATRGRATATAHTRARGVVLHTPISSVLRSRGNLAVLRDIHTQGDPSEDTIAHIITEEDVLNKGVNGVGLLGEDAVVSVLGQVLGVGAVGAGGLDLADQVLVEEELADVVGVGGVETRDGVVRESGSLVGGVGEDYLLS